MQTLDKFFSFEVEIVDDTKRYRHIDIRYAILLMIFATRTVNLYRTSPYTWALRLTTAHNSMNSRDDHPGMSIAHDRENCCGTEINKSVLYR